MFIKRIFFIFALITIAFCFEDCGSEVGSIKALSISNCDDPTQRCVLKRNTNVTMKIDFTTNENVDSITAVVHGIVLGVPVPFKLPNDNGCVDSGLTCPLSAGQTVEYVTIMPVLSKYPRVTVDVKWELKDKNGKDLVCALIPAKIK